MWLPFLLFAVTVLGCFAAILVGMSVSSSMQTTDYIQLMVIVSPLLLVGVLAWRKNWIGVAIGLLPLGINLPVPVIGRFTVPMYFAMLVFAYVLGGVCFRQFQAQVIRTSGAVFVILAGLLTIGRVVWERPGSAMMGGEGGGGQAFLFIMASASFWAFSKISATRDWRPVKTMGIAFILASFAFFYRLVTHVLRGMDAETAVEGGSTILYNLYSRPAWFVVGIAFAWLIWRFGYKKGSMVMAQNFFVLSAFLIGISILTGHRSRPLFAVSTIVVLAYIFREHRKALFMLVAAGFLGFLGLVASGLENVPPEIRRALSIVIPVSEEEARQLAAESRIGGGEMGWESNFRAGMYQIAWDKITTNPIFGAGFTFSRADVLKLMNSMDSKTMGAMQVKLAMGGAYHNSYLQLAVGAGLPVALLALVGTTLIFFRFIRFAIRMDDPKHRFFCAALAAIMVPLMGQVLMNGDGAELFRAFVLLGIMNGVMCNPAFRKEGDPELPPEPVKTPKLSEGDIPAGFGGPLKW